MKFIRKMSCVLFPSLLISSAAYGLAFPGAEGYGADASGGRGGEVYEVTNLDDEGPGSFRDAVSQPNRIVVFRVSGIIDLKSRLQISASNLTIAGQTAPGDGICLRGQPLFLRDSNNVIVRYLRIRPGDIAKQEMDALTIWNCGNVIVDHCSMSWSTDSLNDVVKLSGNVTVQWSILSEPLCQSVHAKGSHGYATGWDGRVKGGASFHHNLIAHAASRAPRIGKNPTGRGLIDVRNNVIYNCGPSYGGEGDDFNFVNNYYRPGPIDFRPDRVIFHVSRGDARAYIAGNFYEGESAISNDNRQAVKFKAATAVYVPNQNHTAAAELATRPATAPATQPEDPGNAEQCLLSEPVTVIPVQTDTAEVAYQRVIDAAGAILPKRDAVDERIINDVKNRTGKLINTQDEVGGWPELKSAAAPADSDHDGMPDAWETAHGLNPTDPADGRQFGKGSTYTNVEVYLNELAATK